MGIITGQSDLKNKQNIGNSETNSLETATNDYLPESMYKDNENSRDDGYKRFIKDNVVTSFRKKLV